MLLNGCAGCPPPVKQVAVEQVCSIEVPPRVDAPEYFGSVNEDILFHVQAYDDSLATCNASLGLIRSAVNEDKEAE